ncbi:Protein of unknown function [Thermoanaerobacter uzonensis DSM 18761]|uniref:DUF1648 domain-containing protein n=1 Tax=Thermoanaerobacter uzonensis DSM 18761 TaxID=1123369 RepID=A0A1M4TE67_9THEO|nr:DUF1648 domain-containing protein [Thermoanaerobacter uzonensis]SHE42678.1 Protein of unknown function [Thermoanaerobacter uzonensis DSM 18761]
MSKRIIKYFYKCGWMFPVITFIINIFAYKYLPESIPLQRDAFGNINYTASKLEFIFFIPILQSFSYIAVKYPQAKGKKKIFHGTYDIAAGAILLLFDIFLLYVFIRK